jgi:hypothetical protein
VLERLKYQQSTSSVSTSTGICRMAQEGDYAGKNKEFEIVISVECSKRRPLRSISDRGNDALGWCNQAPGWTKGFLIVFMYSYCTYYYYCHLNTLLCCLVSIISIESTKMSLRNAFLFLCSSNRGLIMRSVQLVPILKFIVVVLFLPKKIRQYCCCWPA